MPSIRLPPTYVLGLTVAGQAVYWLATGIPYGASPLWTGVVAAQAAFGAGAAVWGWRRAHRRAALPTRAVPEELPHSAAPPTLPPE